MWHLRKVIRSMGEGGDIPEGVRVFSFGSALDSFGFRDIDLLCVYDVDRIEPGAIYGQLRPLFEGLRARYGVRVHPVVLTEREEREVEFARREGCRAIWGDGWRREDGREGRKRGIEAGASAASPATAAGGGSPRRS
jgi:hypothetical protein